MAHLKGIFNGEANCAPTIRYTQVGLHPTDPALSRNFWDLDYLGLEKMLNTAC